VPIRGRSLPVGPRGNRVAPRQLDLVITHDAGDLAEYTSTTNGSPTVTADAAHDGAYGLRLDPDVFEDVRKDINALNAATIGAWFRVNSVAGQNIDGSDIFALRSASDALLVGGRVYHNAGALRIQVTRSNGSPGEWGISADTWYFLETYYVQGSGANAIQGARLWSAGGSVLQTMTEATNGVETTPAARFTVGNRNFNNGATGTIDVDSVRVTNLARQFAGLPFPVSAGTFRDFTAAIRSEAAPAAARSVISQRTGEVRSVAASSVAGHRLADRTAAIRSDPVVSAARSRISHATSTIRSDAAWASARSRISHATATIRSDPAAAAVRSVISQRTALVRSDAAWAATGHRVFIRTAEVRSDGVVSAATSRIHQRTAEARSSGVVSATRSVVATRSAEARSEGQVSAERSVISDRSAGGRTDGRVEAARSVISNRSATARSDASWSFVLDRPFGATIRSDGAVSATRSVIVQRTATVRGKPAWGATGDRVPVGGEVAPGGGGVDIFSVRSGVRTVTREVRIYHASATIWAKPAWSATGSVERRATVDVDEEELVLLLLGGAAWRSGTATTT
jgi:hypothetical protein